MSKIAPAATLSGMIRQIESGELALDLDTAKLLGKRALQDQVLWVTETKALRSIKAPNGTLMGRTLAQKIGVYGDDCRWNRATENWNPPGWYELARWNPLLHSVSPASVLEPLAQALTGDRRPPYVRVLGDKEMKSFMDGASAATWNAIVGGDAFVELAKRYPGATHTRSERVHIKPDVMEVFAREIRHLAIEQLDQDEPLKPVRVYLDEHYPKAG